MLDGVLNVLGWRDVDAAALDRAETSYVSHVAGVLGGHLRDLESVDPGQAADLVAMMVSLDAETLRHVVLAPETSSRVLWGHPGRCDERDLAAYFGDVLPSGVMVPERAGLRVDADSHAAVCFDYTTLRDGGMRLVRYDDGADRDLALSRLDQALLGIDAMDAGVAAFVRRFTLVANPVVDTETPAYTSGSTSQYIGRSLFCNAHLPGVDAGLVAESLVHEAIHSLLYMHEVTEPWILDERRIDRVSVVRSPWSGAYLMLRPFLQACVVWFGLANFWALAAARDLGAFEAERVSQRHMLTRRGFEQGPLLDLVAAYAPNVSPALLSLIAEMQDDVLR